MCFWGFKKLKLTVNPFYAPKMANFGKKWMQIGLSLRL